MGHLEEEKKKRYQNRDISDAVKCLEEKTEEKRGKKTQIKINSEAIKQSLEGKKKKRKKSIV